MTVSELCLIDLAGSEKYVSQGSDRRAEGAHINKSLLTLGKVIYALSEKGTATAAAGVHIPYRDSKLTRILQNSLSGNARVAVVCTINPNPSAVDESLSTLNFAKRIKKVGLHARRNEVDGSMGGLGAEAQALILRYQTEADALRKMVQELERQGAAQVQEVAAVDDERIRELQERLDVIGSLVVRGGRAHDGEPSTVGADSGDEQDDEPGQLRTPSGSSTLSTARSAGLSTPATSRSASQSSCTTAGASAYARPVSPVKRSSAVVASYVFGFDDPPHILAEKLFLANRKIEALSRKLASRPSLPSSSEAQVELVARQQQQIRELEAVCEAQAQDAPPKIREDVEREFAARLAELEHKLEEKDSFIAEIQAESDRLRRANAQLMELAHQQTRDMVENLASPQRKPSPLKTADTNARRRPLDSPTKSRPRPMSLFNPTSSELASAFALDTETKKSTRPQRTTAAPSATTIHCSSWAPSISSTRSTSAQPPSRPPRLLLRFPANRWPHWSRRPLSLPSRSDPQPHTDDVLLDLFIDSHTYTRATAHIQFDTLSHHPCSYVGPEYAASDRLFMVTKGSKRKIEKGPKNRGKMRKND